VVCAAIATSGLGCSAADEEVDRSSATVCSSVVTGGAWWNQPFSEQATQFQIEITATPSTGSIDAVVGLGGSSVSSFAGLAAIVRFNPAGLIDVRSGSSYRADVMQHYEAGVPYRFRFDVDLSTHTYSVWLRGTNHQYTQLARGYAFRNEQAGVTRLGVAAAKVDSAQGTLQLCAFEIVADPVPGCLVATAGSGFLSVRVPDIRVLGTVSFTAQASAPNIDAVIGLSAEPPARFSDLAAAVRLAPNGVVDVRDGDAYRADVRESYSASLRANIQMIADVTSHTYSAFHFFSEVGRQYRFRTEQGAVTHLQYLSVIVDGAEGSATICNIVGTRSLGIAYSREGAYEVVPLPNNEALLHDGTTVQRVDATGTTIAQRPGIGELASDAAGNVFIARVAGTTLTIDKYDPRLVLRWTATRTVLAGARIVAIASDPTGAINIAHTVPEEGSAAVVRWTADGAFASQISIPDGITALDGREAVLVQSTSPLQITRFTATGQVKWTRSFEGGADVDALVADPLHNVVLGGMLRTEIDFGGGPLPLVQNGDGQDHSGFVLKLSPTGAHVFSDNVFVSRLSDVASNGARVAVSGWELANFTHPRLQLFDAVGNHIPWTGDTSFHSDLGNGNSVAIGASGRTWWNVLTRRLPGPWPFWPYLLVLSE
jgi:hypothetical protein